MSAPNPLENTHSSPPAPISSETFHIAGILTTVYGLAELPASCDSISCLWLLHPRLQTKEIMASVGSAIIHGYNKNRSSSARKGLIAVAFDQRNHGTREVNKIANEAWRSGNKRHAQDMFSVFHGTAMDTSLLMDHLGSYIFHEPGAKKIDEHFSLGISLGGHASWQCFFHEPRITASVVIIGCPDYMCVMKDRARLSKLETYTKDKGASFLGSTDFPASLIAACSKWDPKGLLFGVGEINPHPPPAQQTELRTILDSKIKGKSVLVCSGGDDKLVPYHASAKFMEFLKFATGKGGWYEDGEVYVEDVVYDGVGHATSEGMVKDSVRFFCNILEGRDPSVKQEQANL